jgi:hypothetical protein
LAGAVAVVDMVAAVARAVSLLAWSPEQRSEVSPSRSAAVAQRQLRARWRAGMVEIVPRSVSPQQVAAVAAAITAGAAAHPMSARRAGLAAGVHILAPLPAARTQQGKVTTAAQVRIPQRQVVAAAARVLLAARHRAQRAAMVVLACPIRSLARPSITAVAVVAAAGHRKALVAQAAARARTIAGRPQQAALRTQAVAVAAMVEGEAPSRVAQAVRVS